MSNSFHFYPYSKIKLSIIRCRSEMIAYIFVILILTDFQRPTYHWVKSAISERSFSRRVVWQHLHPTPACRWWMSVHTTFFMVAILLSAGEAFHRLAIWVAPKKYFLKDQGADYRVVSPQIIIIWQCISPLSFLWRSLSKGSFWKTSSKEHTDRARCQGTGTRSPSMILGSRKEKQGFEAKPCHISYSSQNPTSQYS